MFIKLVSQIKTFATFVTSEFVVPGVTGHVMSQFLFTDELFGAVFAMVLQASMNSRVFLVLRFRRESSFWLAVLAVVPVATRVHLYMLCDATSRVEFFTTFAAYIGLFPVIEPGPESFGFDHFHDHFPFLKKAINQK